MTKIAKMRPCGCLMEWNEGVFKISLCQVHGDQLKQKEIIDYSSESRSHTGPYR